MDRKRRKNAILILVTEGGDPDAAYRIARCFQEHYELFTCIVPGYCKSAGTLITIGAHELVMTDGGELGPLDIQMSKKDELWESQSGLTVAAALNALHE
jgi:ClpP class serine protease